MRLLLDLIQVTCDYVAGLADVEDEAEELCSVQQQPARFSA